MKNSDEMIRDVHRRIGEYEAAKKRRRRNLLKAAAAAVPVCAAAAVVIGIYSKRPQRDLLTTAPAADLSAYEIQTGTQTVVTGMAQTAQPTEPAAASTAETAPDVTQAPQDTQPAADTPSAIGTDPVSAEPKPAETFLTESAKQTAPEQTDTASGHDVCLRDGDEPTQFYKLIRSYPVMAEYCYDGADNGECFRSVPLTDAMDEYGDSVHYYLLVHLFRDGDLITDSAELRAESERLFAAGYTPAIETVNGTETVFTLNATYDQILNFPVESDHGYFLYLRDEMG